MPGVACKELSFDYTNLAGLRAKRIKEAEHGSFQAYFGCQLDDKTL
jgi:hypothetical protein